MPVTASGPRARWNQRCADVAARLGGSANCKAFCAGQTASPNTVHLTRFVAFCMQQGQEATNLVSLSEQY
jgi:hypothetical protein